MCVCWRWKKIGRKRIVDRVGTGDGAGDGHGAGDCTGAGNLSVFVKSDKKFAEKNPRLG